MTKSQGLLMAAATLAALVAAESNVHAGSLYHSWIQNPTNGHFYRHTSDLMTWWAAEAEAVSAGAHLASIADGVENQWIVDTFVPRPEWNIISREWIGLHFNGSWQWTSGEPVAYTNWALGEPSSPEENYVNIYTTPGATIPAGTWNDLDGTSLQLGIIEIDGAPVPSNASFSALADLNVLDIDLGSLDVGNVTGTEAFAVANIAPTLAADLDLLAVVGSGDTAVLTTDISTFSDLSPGDALNYTAFLDTSTPGTYAASYQLDFGDATGNTEVLTLNLSGRVVPEPSSIVLCIAGLVGFTFLGPRRKL